MTARILAYSYNNRPAYLPNWDGVPVLVRDVGRSLLANWQAGRNPQRPDVREGHWGTRALGWVSELYEDETGLWVRAELNPEGENLIVVQRAFGYVSPGLAWNLTLPSGEVVEGWSLLHVAVTNDPAQYGAAAIMLSRDGEGRSVLYAPAQRVWLSEEWVANDDPFDYPLDAERSWDADESEGRWRAWVSDLEPAEWGAREWRRYRRRFLAYDRANPQRFGSYKLPVVDVVDGEPRLIRRALIAAKAALAGARGGVDLPEAVKERLARRIDAVLREEETMTEQDRKEIAEIVRLAIEPVAKELAELRQAVSQATEEQKKRELERTIEEIRCEIESWRFEGGRVIPPALARQFAVLLARMPEPQRTEMLNVLRANPPLTVRQAQTAQPSQPEPAISALERKFMQQLGISEETYFKYNREVS